MLVEYASTPLALWAAPRQPPESYADLMRDRGDSPTASALRVPDPARCTIRPTSTTRRSTGSTWSTATAGSFRRRTSRSSTRCEEFPDEPSMDAIGSHGVALPGDPRRVSVRRPLRDADRLDSIAGPISRSSRAVRGRRRRQARGDQRVPVNYADRAETAAASIFIVRSVRLQADPHGPAKADTAPKGTLYRAMPALEPSVLQQILDRARERVDLLERRVDVRRDAQPLVVVALDRRGDDPVLRPQEVVRLRRRRRARG